MIRHGAARLRGNELDEFLEIEEIRMRAARALKPRHLRVVSAKEVDLEAIDPKLRVELLMGLQESARLGRHAPRTSSSACWSSWQSGVSSRSSRSPR